MLHRDNCGKGSADSKILKIKGLIILFNSTVQNIRSCHDECEAIEARCLSGILWSVQTQPA